MIDRVAKLYTIKARNRRRNVLARRYGSLKTLVLKRDLCAELRLGVELE